MTSSAAYSEEVESTAPLPEDHSNPPQPNEKMAGGMSVTIFNFLSRAISVTSEAAEFDTEGGPLIWHFQSFEPQAGTIARDLLQPEF